MPSNLTIRDTAVLAMSLRLFPVIDTCRMLRQSAGLQDMRN